jgi:hypothetical protein
MISFLYTCSLPQQLVQKLQIHPLPVAMTDHPQQMKYQGHSWMKDQQGPGSSWLMDPVATMPKICVNSADQESQGPFRHHHLRYLLAEISPFECNVPDPTILDPTTLDQVSKLKHCFSFDTRRKAIQSNTDVKHQRWRPT